MRGVPSRQSTDARLASSLPRLTAVSRKVDPHRRVAMKIRRMNELRWKRQRASIAVNDARTASSLRVTSQSMSQLIYGGPRYLRLTRPRDRCNRWRFVDDDRRHRRCRSVALVPGERRSDFIYANDERCLRCRGAGGQSSIRETPAHRWTHREHHGTSPLAG
jgi:hypothetical protein